MIRVRTIAFKNTISCVNFQTENNEESTEDSDVITLAFNKDVGLTREALQILKSDI